MTGTSKYRHIEILRSQKAVVLVPDDNLTGDVATEELLTIFGELEKDDAPCVVLDLEQVDFINSLALGVIISGHVRISRRGGQLHLCNVSSRIRKVITITKLLETLSLRDTRDAATSLCAG